MKRSYNRTLMHPDLSKAKVLLQTFKTSKYEPHKEPKECRIENLKSWDIIEGGDEARAIEKTGTIDENHEYLVLHFKDGSEKVYRNSYVDLFII